MKGEWEGEGDGWVGGGSWTCPPYLNSFLLLLRFSLSLCLSQLPSSFFDMKKKTKKLKRIKKNTIFFFQVKKERKNLGTLGQIRTHLESCQGPSVHFRSFKGFHW